MINTGKKLEEIISMLNNFRSEIQAHSALGLLNINKHSENFIKRILNLVYDLELESLNEGKSNYPGIDLGDSGERIAFQITSTKKSEKIDDTLKTCLKFKHYDKFDIIRVFILTSRQKSYTLNTVTEPHFAFSVVDNITDFDDLYKVIEHLNPIKMNALYEYLKLELQPAIEAVKNNVSEEEISLLDTSKTLQEINLTNYSHWKATVILKTEKVSVPEIQTRLNSFFASKIIEYMYLPVFNQILRQHQSHKEILYYNNPKKTHLQNYFYGESMQIKESSIHIEKADYTDKEILANLSNEMISLLTSILFFNKFAKGNFEIDIAISFTSNTKVYFFPKDSIVHEQSMNTYALESPYNLNLTISDVHTSTLVDLMQQIMHAFISSDSNYILNNPFFEIDNSITQSKIDHIKERLKIK